MKEKFCFGGCLHKSETITINIVENKNGDIG